MISYRLSGGELVVLKDKRVVLRTRVKAPLEKVLSRVGGEERPLVALALGLAVFKTRRPLGEELLLRAVAEPSKRRILVDIARYYIELYERFGRRAASGVAPAARCVLERLL